MYHFGSSRASVPAHPVTRLTEERFGFGMTPGKGVPPEGGLSPYLVAGTIQGTDPDERAIRRVLGSGVGLTALMRSLACLRHT